MKGRCHLKGGVGGQGCSHLLMVCDTSYEGRRTLVHPVFGVIGGHVHPVLGVIGGHVHPVPIPVLGAVPGDKGEVGHVRVQ